MYVPAIFTQWPSLEVFFLEEHAQPVLVKGTFQEEKKMQPKFIDRETEAHED